MTPGIYQRSACKIGGIVRKGLVDDDAWQSGYLKPGSAGLREIDFWVGA